MADDMATSGGSLHPGRPVIWPTGKPTPTAPSPQASAGTQGLAQAAKPAMTPLEIAQAQAAAQVLERGQVARQFSQTDLRELLLSQNIPDSETNEQLATLMLRYGLEVSKSNFTKLSGMIGTDPSQTTQEAAILLLMKGVDSPAAAKTLSKFLSENPQLASQILSLKGNLQDLLAALQMSRGILEPQMLSQLSGVLAAFIKELDDLPENYKFSGDGSTGRTELSTDLRALKALVDGIPNKKDLPDSAEGQILESTLNSTSNRLDQMIQGVISQALLSKQTSKSDMNYAYYQFPNPLDKKNTVDLIIKRSDEEGGRRIDGSDTEMIMTIQTTNLGPITVKMDVTES